MDRFSAGIIQLIPLLLLLVAFSDSSTFISEDVFNSQGSSTGRSLLQLKDSCPESFEFKNYTGLTSRCKGPKYNTTACCAAFKEFACPYASVLNDPTNNCATTMFSYVNLNGNYPPGLFSSICAPDNSNGFECPPKSDNSSTAVPGNNATGGFWSREQSYNVVLVVVSAVLCFVLSCGYRQYFFIFLFFMFTGAVLPNKNKGLIDFECPRNFHCSLCVNPS